MDSWFSPVQHAVFEQSALKVLKVRQVSIVTAAKHTHVQHKLEAGNFFFVTHFLQSHSNIEHVQILVLLVSLSVQMFSNRII